MWLSYLPEEEIRLIAENMKGFEIENIEAFAEQVS